MIDPSAVRGVVLAGGDSTRFGDGDKALADLNGRPLLAHVVDALTATTDGPPLLAVSSTAEGDRFRAALPDVSVEPVVDDPDVAGPLAGLVAAADAATTPRLLVCGCDMPLVTPAGFDALLEAGADTDEPVDAVVPVVDGHDQPLHALYRREAILATVGALSQGAGPRTLLDRLDAVQRIDAAAVDARLTTAVTNVNTREELERVRTTVASDDG